MRRIVLAAMVAMPLLAVYTYLYTDTFATIDGSKWATNGTVASGTDGLTSTAANGGSVIYTAGLAGPVYEAKATMKITASGGTFVIYSNATSNALSGPGEQGSYYAAEFTPTVSGGGCTLAANYYKRVGNLVTHMASQTLACKTGGDFFVRFTQRTGYFTVFTSLNQLALFWDTSVPAGKPGFGARAMPAGNSITKGEIGNLEATPPGTISQLDVRTALFDNRVDISAPGVVDDANGSGMMMYYITRNDVYMGSLPTPNFSDSTVAPDTPYTYKIYPHDVHLNYSQTTVAVRTPPAGNKDPRAVGVRPTGTYWGASPENIDLQSGNLNFTLPLVTAKGRGGTEVPFRLSSNSLNWRKDNNLVWKLGTDVGFGWGWKMMVGSLTPVYADWWTVSYYKYTDSTGAEYRLDTNDSGIWRSKEGIFVEYDSGAGRLYFPNGMYWEFGCEANGTEADAGTKYPTRLVDSNGNEIKLRYQGGLHYGGENGSSRVTEVEDVRAQWTGSKYRTYLFNYNNDAIPHLTSIASDIGDGQAFGLSYSSGHSLQDPFTAGSYGTVTRLNTLSLPGGSLQYSMEYQSSSQELKKVTMPYGGTVEWVYAPKTLYGVRTQMEVNYRILNALDGQGAKTYTLYHDDAGDTGRPAHHYTVVVDASGAADKVYYFNTAADYRLGKMWMLHERALPSYTTMRQTVVTWAQTGNGNPYISLSEETIYPGVGQSWTPQYTKTGQTLNNQGNLTERTQYAFSAPGTSPALLRTYAYSYLNNGNYTGRHIWDRMTQVTVQKPGGPVVTLVTNTYDQYPGNALNAVTDPSSLRQHDSANYGTYFIYRGNVTRTVSPGKATNIGYNVTGPRSSWDDYRHTISQTPDATRNYAVPSAITAGSLTSTFSWTGFLALSSAVGPNSATASFSYDLYARPSQTTAPNGAVTTYTYSSSAPHWKRALTGTRFTKTSIDGLGRTLKVETGFTGSPDTVLTVVETQYAPCACSPAGKLWRTSLPHAPGVAANWTEYVYDALGRTVSVIQPKNPLTNATWGTTSYLYEGPSVKVTDPAGKWKRYINDALGNLEEVREPNPAGGEFMTSYLYSDLGPLVKVTMARPGVGAGNPATVTQERTWVYNAEMRLTSVTHPESGTTTMEYNADGSMLRKTDAKGQKLEFVYDSDGRVTEARKFPGANEDLCQRVTYSYGSQSYDASFTQNAAGRLAATSTGCAAQAAGQLIEMYSYNSGGAVTKKRLRIVRTNGTVDKDVLYSYGTDGKLATVQYPGVSIPFSYYYDAMDRPIRMSGPSAYYAGQTIDHAKDVVYGVAGQVTSMSYLQSEYDNGSSSEPRYFAETKSYNAMFQLTRQTTTWSGGTAADVSYTFADSNSNGRITARKNWYSGEEVLYQYDSLNRVISASVSGSGGWGQSFAYDGFGNLLGQTVTKGTAPSVSLSVHMATNRISTYGYDNNGNTTSMPALGGGTASIAYDVSNRMISWDGPAGVETYRYLGDNKRVWKRAPNGAETVYFYGAGGEKLMTYSVTGAPFALNVVSWNVYFAGKMIEVDPNI